MNITSEKVKSPILGIGTIIEQGERYIKVEFAVRTSKFMFPAAFERFLEAVDKQVQAAIDALLNEMKEEKEARRPNEKVISQFKEERKMSAASDDATKQTSKKIDEMFSEDYHADHLARQPILNYKQVESQFGITISGFGRGINSTPSCVVLISSIGKSKGNFVYHDKWTIEGEYIYSGEGKSGDQSMTKGNLAVKNTSSDGKEIHLFVKFSPQEYYYQGVFELVNYTYEDEKDENGCIRKEYKFCLKKVHDGKGC